jgi:phosphoglycerate kinase
MNKKTVRDLTDAQLRGRRALVRVDFNVPLDADRRVADDTRITAALPTLRFLTERGARVVLLSHLGRPKGAPEPKYSLRPVADRLAELMPGTGVDFCETTDTADAIQATERLGDGQVLLLENTRFLAGEEANDERLARDLAKLGDLYVNDAFGAAHRAHASTEGIAHHLRPAVAGLLMEKELAYLGRALAEPERPFVAILGGAKISGKLDVIAQLLPKVDRMLIGGAMANTFLRAMGLETGRSLVEEDRVEMARQLLATAGEKLVLPTDAVVAAELSAEAASRTVARDAIPSDQAMYDVGPQTIASSARSCAPRRPCSGTARWASSRRRRSTRDARGRAGTRGGDRARRDDDRRRWRLGGCDRAGGARRAGHARLHRRGRVARVPRGEDAAGRRGTR